MKKKTLTLVLLWTLAAVFWLPACSTHRGPTLPAPIPVELEQEPRP